MKAIAALVFWISTSANAYFATGDDLLLKIEKGSQMGEAYVAGAFDAYQGVVHCAPNSVKLVEIVAMLKTYLQLESTDLDKPADELVGRMLGTTWPCTKKSEKVQLMGI